MKPVPTIPLEELIRARALLDSGWNTVKTARELGVGFYALRDQMKAAGLYFTEEELKARQVQPRREREPTDTRSVMQGYSDLSQQFLKRRLI